VRVVLADDHRMVRDGLRAVLEKVGIEVVGDAANGYEAVTAAKRVRPDAVVMDIGMPELNGIDATRRLVAELPGIKVIALSMNSDRRYVVAVFEAGAVAYVVKNAASEELVNALEAAGRGETYVSPSIGGSGLRAAVGSRARPGPLAQRPLSAREREVLQLIAEGKSSKEAGGILGIAVTTVETHRRQIMEKLGLRTVAELTKYAVREGLTSGER